MTRDLSLRTCRAYCRLKPLGQAAVSPFTQSLGLGGTEPFGEWWGTLEETEEKVAKLTLWFVWLRSGDRGLHTSCKNEKAQFQASESVVGDCSSIWENIFHICHKKFKMSEDSHRRPQDPQSPWPARSPPLSQNRLEEARRE